MDGLSSDDCTPMHGILLYDEWLVSRTIHTVTCSRPLRGGVFISSVCFLFRRSPCVIMCIQRLMFRGEGEKKKARHKRSKRAAHGMLCPYQSMPQDDLQPPVYIRFWAVRKRAHTRCVDVFADPPFDLLFLCFPALPNFLSHFFPLFILFSRLLGKNKKAGCCL